MKAVVFHQPGGPEALTYGEVPTPDPKQGEALLRVEACGLNHLDIWVRQGLGAKMIPMPHILGCEIVGTLVSGAGPLKKSQRVLVAPGVSCGVCSACAAGRDSLCKEFKIVGFQLNGGYAEYAVVPQRNLIPVEGPWKPEEWAAVGLVFLTAWHMLITKAGLQPGETVLIQGGGSGIGSAAIQIAKMISAEVIAVVGSDKKARKAKSLGADVVINHTKSDFVEETLKRTNQEGVNVVFEHVGPATWNGSMRCLARGGRLVTCGATTGPKVELDLRYFYTKELSVIGSYMGSRQELERVLSLIAKGVLKPVVDTVFPLKEAARAHERMESRDFFGKLVLQC